MTAFATVAACTATNGDPIPPEVYDAEALDAGGNPDDPDGGGKADGASDAGKDAPADTGKDSPVTPAVIVISELYIDHILDGDGAEFVELRAAPGTKVDDLKLRLIESNGSFTEINAGPTGATVGTSGYWVVSGGNVLKLKASPYREDNVVPLAQWGLDYPGAVQLLRGTTLLDVVGFTDVPDGGAVAAPSSPPNATSEGKPALMPDNSGATTNTKRLTLSRKSGDTNNNAADFCVTEASPGHPTNPCKP